MRLSKLDVFRAECLDLIKKVQGDTVSFKKIFEHDGKKYSVELASDADTFEAVEVIPVSKITEWVEVAK